MVRKLPVAVLVLLLSSCEGKGADEKLSFFSGTRLVEVTADKVLGEEVMVRDHVIFGHAAEVIRIHSPQGVATAASMAETRAAGRVSQWLALRPNSESKGQATAVTLNGGVTLLQKVEGQKVHVFRAYQMPR